MFLQGLLFSIASASNFFWLVPFCCPWRRDRWGFGIGVARGGSRSGSRPSSQLFTSFWAKEALFLMAFVGPVQHFWGSSSASKQCFFLFRVGRLVHFVEMEPPKLVQTQWLINPIWGGGGPLWPGQSKTVRHFHRIWARFTKIYDFVPFNVW